jgi:hypothetical protein
MRKALITRMAPPARGVPIGPAATAGPKNAFTKNRQVNGTGTRRSVKIAIFLCNQLLRKTFAFANAPLAYANLPGVTCHPFSRCAAPSFSLGSTLPACGRPAHRRRELIRDCNGTYRRPAQPIDAVLNPSTSFSSATASRIKTGLGASPGASPATCETTKKAAARRSASRFFRLCFFPLPSPARFSSSVRKPR